MSPRIVCVACGNPTDSVLSPLCIACATGMPAKGTDRHVGQMIAARAVVSNVVVPQAMTTDTRDALLNAARRIDERCAMDGEGPIERFERLAKLFRRETGFTAPGKDMLALSFADEDYERRIEAWDAWSKAPFDDLRAALRTPRPEDARDAARYRWLRDRMSLEDIPEEHPDWSTPDEMESARIDAAIDAALTQPEATR